jgi:hypothetical protein
MNNQLDRNETFTVTKGVCGLDEGLLVSREFDTQVILQASFGEIALNEWTRPEEGCSVCEGVAEVSLRGGEGVCL